MLVSYISQKYIQKQGGVIIFNKSLTLHKNYHERTAYKEFKMRNNVKKNVGNVYKSLQINKNRS